MDRRVISELLDSDFGTPAEVARSLSDLRRINRWAGGVSTTRRMLERVAQRFHLSELSLLDTGSGSGYLPLAVARRMAFRGTRVRVTLLDRAITHFPNSSFSKYLVAGDARALPFRDDTFDVVSCSLLVHHFEPDDVVRFADEALRVARLAVVINDLHRSRLHLAASYAGFLLYRSRLTRHDAPASVRRAYTFRELREILQRSRAASIEINHQYLFRLGAIAWKRAHTT